MEESTPSLPERATPHTPGPWQVHPVDYLLVVDNDGNEIARVVCEPGTDEHDARLIAASPDLAEALEAALPTLADRAWRLQSYDKDGDPLERSGWESEAMYAAARAALAKAGRP